jgi:hypothetical protein
VSTTRSAKGPRTGGVPPNLEHYEHDVREFNWALARSWLDGLPRGQGLNNAVAIRWLGKHGTREDITVESRLCT